MIGDPTTEFFVEFQQKKQPLLLNVLWLLYLVRILAWPQEAGDKIFAVVNTYTRASHFNGLSAENCYRLQRVGGNILGIKLRDVFKSQESGDVEWLCIIHFFLFIQVLN